MLRRCKENQGRGVSAALQALLQERHKGTEAQRHRVKEEKMKKSVTGFAVWKGFICFVFIARVFAAIYAQELRDVPQEVREAIIVNVKDGDTLVTKSGEVIRLLGVNTPEKGWPYAVTAAEFVKAWVVDKKVTLKISKKYPKDKYGRTLAVVFVGDEKMSLNLKLISLGLGKVLIEKNDLVNVSVWRAAQEEAVKMKRGIWGVAR